MNSDRSYGHLDQDHLGREDRQHAALLAERFVAASVFLRFRPKFLAKVASGRWMACASRWMQKETYAIQ